MAPWCLRSSIIPADYLVAASWQGSGVELVTPSRRQKLPVAAVVAEVVAALLLVGLAWWCWHRGVIVTVRRGVAMNRIEGRWWALATGEVTLAGLLLLDAAGRVTSERARQHGG
jgi:hypothetical protein